MVNYTREQLAKLYKELPNELKDWIAADDTNDKIYQALQDNGILDERCGLVSDLIRNVLFGLLPPEDFQSALEKEVKFKKDLAKKITQEINRFVFFPIKIILNDLYKIEAAAETQESQAEAGQQETAGSESQEKKLDKSDSYLEPIE